MVVLPGTKTTVRDLYWIRATGLAARINRLAREQSGPIVLGICGGFQLLGRRIEDPLGVESPEPSVEGLGLLNVTTCFRSEKERHRVSGQVQGWGAPVVGYEIHMGETLRGEGVEAWINLVRERDGTAIEDGAVDGSGRIFGTYVHGLFDSLPFCAALIDRVRRRRGLPALDVSHWEDHRTALASRYAGLAALLREHVDLSWLTPDLWARRARHGPDR
jgi:adenosylcobyric acid synthase